MAEDKIKIIDNFLPENIFKDIQSIMMGPCMPWYYQKKAIAKSNIEEDFIFTHVFYGEGNQPSELFERIIHPILGRLNFNYLLRARGRLITKRHKHTPQPFHQDLTTKHTVALFSINTNNGHTLFEDGTKHFSTENTLLLFNGELKHATVPQTDTSVRININFNFE